MIIVALGFLLFPLLNRATPSLLGHQEYNLKLYQNSLNELNVQNSLGAIRSDHYQTACNELQRQLLDDVHDHSNKSSLIVHRNYWTAFFLFCIVPSIALLLYLHWGDSKQVQQLMIEQSNIEQEKKLHEQLGSPQQVILQLQQHLQQHPQSAEGWYLLGRLYASQQQFSQANFAFAKAYQLAPRNIEILMNYAEVLSVQNNDQITDQAAKMLKEILILQPNNDAARNLLAIYSYQQKDYQSAINYWEEILPHYSSNSMDSQIILQAITKAQKALGNKKPPF